MALIPREFINDLLARCDIVEIIDARVPLRKKGNNHSACCPFHNEKTPSFSVSQSKQFYHCFGCGVSGNAISFLMDYDRLSFVEAIELLANQCGLQVPHEEGQVQAKPQNDLYELMERAAKYYQQELRQHQPAIDYLKHRGLSGQIAKDFGIGYAPAGWDALLKLLGNANELLAAGLIIKKPESGFYDRFRDRIMFPIRDRRGRVIGFGGRIINQGEPKYLNSPETSIFHKGSELYGLYEANKAVRNLERILVVEGYMDVVALAQYDIRNVVATLGTATTADHITRLFRVTSEVVFSFDGDKAGQAAAWRALEVSLPLLQDGWSIRFLFLPEGEDPDSCVRKEGKDGFHNRLTQAQTLPDFLFSHLLTQVNLNSMEGKAKLAKLAMPLINKVPAGVLQHKLYEQLANLVRMDVETLKQVKGVVSPKILNKPSSQTKAAVATKRSPMRLAIALLIQNPQLAEMFPAELSNIILPGSDLLNALVALLKQSPGLNIGILLEHWRDQPEYIQLKQLAAWDTAIPEEGIEQEFQGVLKNLQKLDREAKIDQLIQRANLGGLSSEEKLILQNLITESKPG